MTVPPHQSADAREAGRRAWRLVGAQSGLRDTLARIEAALGAHGIPRVYVGSVALVSYGVCQVTNDIDLCVRAEHRSRCDGCLGSLLTADGRRFCDLRTGSIVRVIPAGPDLRGPGGRPVVHMPDPQDAVWVDDVPVPSLASLIALTLARGRFRDLGHVVELIRIQRLDADFADHLDRTARAAYLQCYDQMIEEDRYNPQVHDPPAEAPRTRWPGD